MSDIPSEAPTGQSRKNEVDLETYAADAAENVTISQRGQIPEGLSLVGALGSLGYYLADFTEYFNTGATFKEVPLYLAFIALSGVAAANLSSICGRKDPKTQIRGTLTGAASGFGIGASIAGLAMALVADVFTMGAATAAGGVVGYLRTRRGRKVHTRCKQKLPCDTWICTKCKHIVVPAREWQRKDRWNLLDVADYLDTGGLEMDALQSVAFMEYSGVFKDALTVTGLAPTWDPKEIRSRATDMPLVQSFGHKWHAFADTAHLYKSIHDKKEVAEVLRLWQSFLVESQDKVEPQYKAWPISSSIPNA